ncbi:DUF5671 domain-containing protein [Paracoccus aurantiacus]|uniref:DUF5671 domain-containing protein n=1 Tax=Paracoccus aurantiacus TaxID=2599412 RepID=UPI00164C0E40|nr:DUF5671 domain-containing protein [Paracoccus aurantiacus]
MRPSEQITEFVHAALQSGRSRAEIDAALQSAGWSERERTNALDGWISAEGLPPVPRPRPYVSAREALVYGLLFISLGVVAIHLVMLGFRLTDALLPDPDRIRPYRYAYMRWPISALIAFTPAFLLLNRAIQRRSAADQGHRRSLVRKWVASVTLLLATISLLGDLVATVYALLDGDMTLRFTIKALIVAGVAGLVFAYYRDELNEDAADPSPARQWGVAVTAIGACAAIAVIAGLMVGGGPIRARQENRDEQRLEDLRAINRNIECQAADTGRLPDAPQITDLCPSPPPADNPATGEAYTYTRIDDRHWRVCAAFELPELVGDMSYGAQFDAQSGCLVSEWTGRSEPNFVPMDQFEVAPAN